MARILNCALCGLDLKNCRNGQEGNSHFFYQLISIMQPIILDDANTVRENNMKVPIHLNVFPFAKRFSSGFLESTDTKGDFLTNKLTEQKMSPHNHGCHPVILKQPFLNSENGRNVIFRPPPNSQSMFHCYYNANIDV